MRNAIEWLRRAGWAEAVSFLVLLGIAMPLKYIWGKPVAVQIAGSIHGALFVLFCIALGRVMKVARWPMSRGALVFASAFIPGGPFFMDARLRRYEAEAARD